MTTVPVRSLDSVKEHAELRSDAFCEAEKTRSMTYIELAIRTPKGATANDVYKVLTPDMKKTVTEKSWAAMWSLTLRVERLFNAQKKDGKHAKFPTVVDFVDAKRSIWSADKALSPVSAEPKKSANPSVGGEAKSSSTKSVSVSKETTVDAFGEVCRLVDGLNESDLKALAMLVADRIAKFEAKATAKV